MNQYNLRLAKQSDIQTILTLYEGKIDYKFGSKSPSIGCNDEIILENLKNDISNPEDVKGLYVIENLNKNILASCNIYSAFHRNGYTFLQFYYKKDINETTAKELLEIVMNLCFQELNYNKLNIDVRSTQIEFYSVFIKCGFQIEVTLREHFFTQGSYEDIIRLGLTKYDYINKTIFLQTLQNGALKNNEDYIIKPNVLPTKPLLRGEKVYLSPISADDIDLIYNLCSETDDVYFASIAAAAPTSYHSIKRLSQKENDYIFFHEGMTFGIKKNDGNIVGTINANFIDNRNRNLMLGLTIYSTSDRGNGYGSEAIKLFTDFAFLEMNMHRVYLGCFSFNDRAFNLYKHIGFKPEGINRSFIYRNGNYYDEYVLGVLKQEWLNLRGYL